MTIISIVSLLRVQFNKVISKLKIILKKYTSYDCSLKEFKLISIDSNYRDWFFLI